MRHFTNVMNVVMITFLLVWTKVEGGKLEIKEDSIGTKKIKLIKSVK
jgi:hypothetical protein